MRSEFSRLVHPLDIGLKAPSDDRISLICGPTQVQLSRDAAYELQYQLARLLAELEATEDAPLFNLGAASNSDTMTAEPVAEDCAHCARSPAQTATPDITALQNVHRLFPGGKSKG